MLLAGDSVVSVAVPGVASGVEDVEGLKEMVVST